MNRSVRKIEPPRDFSIGSSISPQSSRSRSRDKHVPTIPKRPRSPHKTIKALASHRRSNNSFVSHWSSVSGLPDIKKVDVNQTLKCSHRSYVKYSDYVNTINSNEYSNHFN